MSGPSGLAGRLNDQLAPPRVEVEEGRHVVDLQNMFNKTNNTNTSNDNNNRTMTIIVSTALARKGDTS